ncbi:MAG: 2-phosphosulfolactate phosphatase [Desulfosalsimonas sp.]
MDIRIVNYARGAAESRGLAVIIDVFRAFSAACYAFDRGAQKIIASESLDTARELKKQNPHYLLMGERHAKKPPDFDFGNSPSEISEKDLSGKTLVHTTHAGTKALLAARRAETVITGSFVNAGAVAGFIKSLSPPCVFLVCAGFEGKTEAAEDTLCANYIRQLLLGQPPGLDSVAQKLRTAPSAVRFFNPEDTDSPEIDFHMCLNADRFSFVIRRTRADRDSCLLEPARDFTKMT